MVFFLFYGLIYVLLCLWVGSMGSKRECGAVLGFLIAFFTSPLLGAIIVLLFRKKKSKTELLVEAKVLLDSGVITQTEHKFMVEDIMRIGKLRDISYYKR